MEETILILIAKLFPCSELKDLKMIPKKKSMFPVFGVALSDVREVGNCFKILILNPRELILV